MPDFEFDIFSTSDAFVSDPEATIKPFVDYAIEFGRSKGLLSLHYGILSEDSSKGCLMMGWDSIKSLETLMSDPVIHDDVVRLMGACALPGASPDMSFYTFSGSLSEVLSGPESEFAVVKYREGQTHEDALVAWENNFLPLLQQTEGWVAASGPGPSIKTTKNSFMLAMAWKSMELYNKARQASDYNAAARSMGLGGALVSFAHVKLVKGY